MLWFFQVSIFVWGGVGNQSTHQSLPISWKVLSFKTWCLLFWGAPLFGWFEGDKQHILAPPTRTKAAPRPSATRKVPHARPCPPGARRAGAGVSGSGALELREASHSPPWDRGNTKGSQGGDLPRAPRVVLAESYIITGLGVLG